MTKHKVHSESMADKKQQAGAGAASNTGKGKRTSQVDPNETKADKFKRLGGVRVAKALKAIRVIGNLSGSGYEYTPDQIEKINTALSNELKSAVAKFNKDGSGPKAKETFTF